MKKTLKNLGKFLMLLVLVSSCQDDDKTFGDLDAPQNLEITYTIEGQNAEYPDGDGTGNVMIKAIAEGAVTYKFSFSDLTNASSPTGEYTKQFTQNGVHTYTITATAFGRGGVSTSKSVEVTVLSNFSDEEAVAFLTGGSTKKWYFAADQPAHLGVGPNDANTATNFEPGYYGAAPWEKAGSPDSSCLYDNELTFSKEGNFIKYSLNNGGRTFFNSSFNSVGGSSSSSDQCSPFETGGSKTVSLSPSTSLVAPENKRGTVMNFSDGGFMGYYIGTSTYEIMSITDTKMVVRAVMGGNNALAWYHTFTNVKPVQGGSGEPDTDYTTEVWADEFNTDGAPDPSKWTMEIGTGQNGWGNNEKQYYRAENAVVSGGTLKITAKKETFAGSQYTSARMNTFNKKDFTYGKVEIRAKLPSGGGTWPALWALGSNFQQTPWPGCGEIDIMEHIGNNQNNIQANLHFPGNSGGNGIHGEIDIQNAAEEFHVYTCVWSPDTIKFYVDNVEFHSFNNSAAVPFNSNFFLIMNVAMGGNLGGNIDPNFTQSTMEVDYIKLFQ